MPPREIRDYASPLLQPPINRLFVPRPIPDYLGHIDRDRTERTGPKLGSMATFVKALNEAAETDTVQDELSAEFRRKQRLERRKLADKERIEADLAKWSPKEYAGEEVTSDPFKTLFVGGLNYAVTDRQLKHEFERFGAVKKVTLIKCRSTGKPRGYAFIEFEKERDVRIAYADGDGMKIEGKRVFVDIERGRTVAGFRPRRLGGGLGSSRLGGKMKNQRQPLRDSRARPEVDSYSSGSKRPRSRSRSRERRRY